MPIDVQPGSTVRVSVIREPTNEAAAKTLSRVFGSGSGARAARQVRKQHRRNKKDPRTRGGRPWVVAPKAPRLYNPKKGDACRLFATSSLINDLRSISRFVEVAVD